MIDLLASHYIHVAAMVVLSVGLYGVIASPNLVKKVVGLNVFQVGIFLFFIGSGFVEGGEPPIGTHGPGPYVSPLPQVLILTAIVVGVSLTAVALALIVRIYDGYGSLDESVIREVRTDD
ncbi:MAG: cation:proton antiporter subunit C [Halodesulfurarchaeum sp.]